MSEPFIEGEAIEEVPGEAGGQPGAEMVRAGDAVPAPTTLFHTDDPVAVMRKATEVANALADAVRNIKDDQGKPKLVSTISGREHVRVEGWTMLGSMLGVFPVPVWSRKLTDPEGWEARVEARTLQGHTIGAAEAQCTRDEKMWGYNPTGRNGQRLDPRDDFALRSMAQTRATSKCLRLPLGFVMTLAGFDPTPAEEMPASESARPQPQRRQEGPPPFPVPQSWAKIEEAIKNGMDNPTESWAIFQAHIRAAAYHLFGKVDQSELDREQRIVLLRKAAGATCWLMDNTQATLQPPEFHFGTVENIRQAWASVMDGAALAIPDYVPPEPDHPQIDEEAAEAAAQAAASDYS